MLVSDVASLRPKVVIWDIDGTLWNGVIDSSTRSAPRPTVRLIGELTERGVVNSICSNNDPQQARDLLNAWGVLPNIAFEQIGWEGKLSAVGRMLAFFQVAAAVVVVVDDDARVREQLASCLGVTTLAPELVEAADLSQWGDTTTGRRRLDHYKLLARRQQAFVESCAVGDTGVVAFLRESRVRLMSVDPAANVDRIAELSYRSNRLNLTRSRIDCTELEELVVDPHLSSWAFRVVDRFGDYGVCGFVVVEPSTRSLIHFFWSCRVLNQGVVEFVAEHLLGETFDIDICHPAFVDFGGSIDWVSWSLDYPVRDPKIGPVAPRLVPQNFRTKVLLIGGCDMDIVASLWSNSGSVEVIGLTTEDGVQRYAQSSVALMAAHATTDLEASGVTGLPWDGSIPDPHTWIVYDLVVISLWVDYSSSTVRHRDDPREVWAPQYIRLTEASSAWEWDHWAGNQLDQETYFRDFIHGPPLCADRLAAHIDELATLAHATAVVLLGAPELNRGIAYPHGADQCERNRDLNAAVRKACARHPNMKFHEVTDIVTDPDKLIRPDDPTGFHYRRDVYAQIARSLERVATERRAR